MTITLSIFMQLEIVILYIHIYKYIFLIIIFHISYYIHKPLTCYSWENYHLQYVVNDSLKADNLKSMKRMFKNARL